MKLVTVPCWEHILWLQQPWGFTEMRMLWAESLSYGPSHIGCLIGFVTVAILPARRAGDWARIAAANKDCPTASGTSGFACNAAVSREALPAMMQPLCKQGGCFQSNVCIPMLV